MERKRFSVVHRADLTCLSVGFVGVGGPADWRSLHHYLCHGHGSGDEPKIASAACPLLRLIQKANFCRGTRSGPVRFGLRTCEITRLFCQRQKPICRWTQLYISTRCFAFFDNLTLQNCIESLRSELADSDGWRRFGI